MDTMKSSSNTLPELHYGEEKRKQEAIPGEPLTNDRTAYLHMAFVYNFRTTCVLPCKHKQTEKQLHELSCWTKQTKHVWKSNLELDQRSPAARWAPHPAATPSAPDDTLGRYLPPAFISQLMTRESCDWVELKAAGSSLTEPLSEVTERGSRHNATASPRQLQFISLIMSIMSTNIYSVIINRWSSKWGQLSFFIWNSQNRLNSWINSVKWSVDQ